MRVSVRLRHHCVAGSLRVKRVSDLAAVHPPSIRNSARAIPCHSYRYQGKCPCALPGSRGAGSAGRGPWVIARRYSSRDHQNHGRPDSRQGAARIRRQRSLHQRNRRSPSRQQDRSRRSLHEGHADRFARKGSRSRHSCRGKMSAMLLSAQMLIVSQHSPRALSSARRRCADRRKSSACVPISKWSPIAAMFRPASTNLPPAPWTPHCWPMRGSSVSISRTLSRR